MNTIIDEVVFDDRGLIPCIVQDADNNEVLMLAYMNRESLEKTIENGKACFWSRSRSKLWLKGETSGNYQLVREIRVDCDSDTILLKVKPIGPACHTGNQSCFYRKLNSEGNLEKVDRKKEIFLKKAAFLWKLYYKIQDRKLNPKKDSYTNYLFREGIDKICKKIGEESAEVIIGVKNNSSDEIIYEVSDLVYHLIVLLNIYDISL
jgi:phosphoribosyl-AMP cyclohydrolase / phosphoribosyl-ATP pyrophosphohydrolase